MINRTASTALGVRVLSTAILLACGLRTQAQPAQSPQSAGSPRAQVAGERERGTPPPELRDETFRLMDAYVISNLQESLGLTEDQFARTLPLVKRLQSERRGFARKRMQALRSLRRALNSGSATEAAVADLLKEVKNAALDERAATTRNLEALDAALTPLQQAKYRVFEAEVDSRLRRLRSRTSERNPPKGD
jgi:Spy/CpxP family protein refolding chaperone